MTIKQKTFGVSVRLNLEVGIGIKADNMADAVAKAQAMKVSDIVDFKANGWEHNDSEAPVIKGVYAYD